MAACKIVLMAEPPAGKHFKEHLEAAGHTVTWIDTPSRRDITVPFGTTHLLIMNAGQHVLSTLVGKATKVGAITIPVPASWSKAAERLTKAQIPVSITPLAPVSHIETPKEPFNPPRLAAPPVEAPVEAPATPPATVVEMPATLAEAPPPLPVVPPARRTTPSMLTPEQHAAQDARVVEAARRAFEHDPDLSGTEVMAALRTTGITINDRQQELLFATRRSVRAMHGLDPSGGPRGRKRNRSKAPPTGAQLPPPAIVPSTSSVPLSPPRDQEAQIRAASQLLCEALAGSDYESYTAERQSDGTFKPRGVQRVVTTRQVTF